MTFVVDASIAVKWLFAEPDSAAASQYLSEELIAPTLFRLECANAIVRRLRLRQITSPEAAFLIREIDYMPVELRSFSEHETFALAVELAHSVNDCAYLALARSQGLRLVTADERFATAAKLGGYRASIQGLTSPDHP